MGRACWRQQNALLHTLLEKNLAGKTPWKIKNILARCGTRN